VAAFGIAKTSGDTWKFDGVMLIAADGSLRHLDAAGLATVDTESGEPMLPFTAGSLSPDGTRLAFRQPQSVAVYDLRTGHWRDLDTSGAPGPEAGPTWGPNGSTIRVDGATVDVATGRVTVDRVGSPLDQTGLHVESWVGADRVIGDTQAGAAGYLDESIGLAGVESNPPAIVVVGASRALLLIPDQGERWKYCCAVAGWLDPTTVAYESTSGSGGPGGTGEIMRVLAWNTATDRFGIVTTVRGSTDMTFVGSYTDLYR
jgi:hypothetical protein